MGRSYTLIVEFCTGNSTVFTLVKRRCPSVSNLCIDRAYFNDRSSYSKNRSLSLKSSSFSMFSSHLKVLNLMCISCGLSKKYAEHLRGVSYQYHCPVAGCVYDTNSERFFSCVKYLRQHYQKIHAAKEFFCEKCKKGFAKPSELAAHVQSCGSTFTCSCGYEYSTRAALLTHAKRKMHTLPREQQSGFRKMQKTKQQPSPPTPFLSGAEREGFTKPPTVIIFVNGDPDLTSLRPASANPSPSSSPRCDATSQQKPCFILPKPARAVATSTFDELAAGSGTPKRFSIGVQTSGPEDCPCHGRDLGTGAKRSAETQTPCKPRTALDARGTQTEELADLSNVSTQTLLAYGAGTLLEQDVFGDGWPLAEASPFSLVNDKFSQTMEDLGVSVNFPLGVAVSSSTQTSPGCARLPHAVEQLDQSLHCYLGMDNLPSLQDFAVDSPGRQPSGEARTERRLDALFLGGDSDPEDEAGILSSNMQTQTSSELESMALHQLLSNMETQTSDPFLFPDLSGLCDIQTQTARGGSPSLVDTHTQTHREGLLAFAAPQIDMETQTFLSLLEGGDAALTDSHTQTSTDIMALLDYCSGAEEP